MHILRGRRHLFLENLVCFIVYYTCFLIVYDDLRYVSYLCFVAFIASCLYVGHAFILILLYFIGCMFGWSFALLYDHCGNFHMTVLYLIKLLICVTSCLLDRYLLVTLYLFFYHLIYLESLMRFVQVFQVCFVVYYTCFLVVYGALRYVSYLCFVTLIASCLYVGHAFILMLLCFIGCMFGWSFALLYDHCGHFHMTILYLIKLLICVTLCLLDRYLLVTLYLSFHYLIYLESLMCFV